ncbi:nidogen-2 [Rhinatrema bivittatum]|uniref:nidogen-2 n=1 Tax=Rhinatrema bivittatum TaxID=194408 RepID=UPI00112CB8F7|nr:nidogen-2 [Rhinatrema bivittatum]
MRERGAPLVLCLHWLMGFGAAVGRRELFPYGEHRGDLLLLEGDDETSEVVTLKQPLFFYEAPFSHLYVGTNGIISTQDFPRETQYVDDGFPTDFPAIAPFLSDIDTSNGKGKIYYRQDNSDAVLARAAVEIRRGFPRASFHPTNVFLVTWDSVGAYEEVTRLSAPSNRFNTFQAVLASDDANTYAILLYPEDGLQFFGTRPKESYNVHLELPARVGFSRGESEYLKREGPYYSVTSTEQSVKNLYQTSNSGIPGVWIFHIGSTSRLGNVVPAEVGVKISEGQSVLTLGSTLSKPEHHKDPENEYTDENVDYHESLYDENEDDIDYPPELEPEVHATSDVSLPSNIGPHIHSDYNEPRHPDTIHHQPDSGYQSVHPHLSNINHPSGSKARTLDLDKEVSVSEVEVESRHQTDGRILLSSKTREGPLHSAIDDLSSYNENENVQPFPDGGAVPSETDILPDFPEGEVVLQSFPLPESAPPSENVRRVVGVEDDINFGTKDNPASKDTCEKNHGQCSQHAFCTDYSTGFCCHCLSEYYGNGRYCLPKGAPHRVNGKVSGKLSVGQVPVHFSNVDLHAYIVLNDGRAYTAISHIPEPASWALLPLSPIGGLFGWLFALERSGYKNGFSIIGAKFTHNIEVTFYPREEKVHITQTADGLDSENYLNLKTSIEGQVPYIPEDSTVKVSPYNEVYHYSSSVVTSKAYREYSVSSSSGETQKFTYRLRQNITYQDCSHARSVLPGSQKLSVDRVFVLYNKDEKILRYAMTNHIGPMQDPTHPERPAMNPCYDGTHACDTSARCQPGPALDYTCECATGFQGDGRDCVDIDECGMGFSRCGRHSVCVNLPGSYRCECQPEFQFAADGRTCVPISPARNPCDDGSHSCAAAELARCIPQAGGSYRCVCLPGYVGDGQNCTDVDECLEDRCHPAAACHNAPGSFSCRCTQGYEGDGFQCSLKPEKPQKTACLEKREQLQAELSPRGPRPYFGLHIPQCDDQGNYQPLQCHSSTGHCWCVDAAGQEIPGTRTPPGNDPPRCGIPEPTRKPQTVCERWRQSLLEHYGGQPTPQQYVPQCDYLGNFSPLQCHGNSGYCWCVDKDGREIQGTRTEPGFTPACIPTVAPPPMKPSPRPDVTLPAVGTFLLYAQGQQIGYLPLNGTKLHKETAKTLLSLHGSIVVGIDYDCQEKMVYWTDVAGRTINRASLEPGAEPETVISSGLMSTEGLAIDYLRRTMFWTDSGFDKIESAKLDGSERKVLFDTDLVNPRAITVDASRGNLYWTDWNREAPKIETSFIDGSNRRILVNDEIGLPNGLTFDPLSKQICWADAGTKKLECILSNGAGRHAIQDNLNYPFSVVAYSTHFYHTDWRRDGVIVVNKETGRITDEYLPEQRSHLYGITVVHPYCLSGKK